jgi:hypothetical protein
MWQHAFYLYRLPILFSLSFVFVLLFLFIMFIALIVVDVVFFLTNKAIKSWSGLFQQSSAADTYVFTDCYLAYGLQPLKWTCVTTDVFLPTYLKHLLYLFIYFN